MSGENKKKDWWDRADIIAKVCTPLVVLGVASYLNYVISGNNQRTTLAQRDVSLISEFSTCYAKDESRGLAPHVVKCISDEEVKLELRTFMLWNLEERNLKKAPNWIFNKEDADWHTLGDILYQMETEKRGRNQQNWENFKKSTLDRWEMHKAELSKLYSWVEKTYTPGYLDKTAPPGSLGN